MYINAVANSAMLQLYLRHTIKHELYTASGSALRPQIKNSERVSELSHQKFEIDI